MVFPSILLFYLFVFHHLFIHVVGEDNATVREERTRIAFGSCHKNKLAASPPIWDTIRVVEQPDIWIWTGDAIYPSNKDPKTGRKTYGPSQPLELQKEYEILKENSTVGYQAFLNSPVEIYGTWDDHDYGGNDGGNSMPDKEMRKDAFWKFLGYTPHSHSGVYHSVDLENGRIQLLMLDTRWFRQDHCIPSLALKMPLGNAIACFTRWLSAGLNLDKFAWLWGVKDCKQNQFLGEEQWKWLEESLLSSSQSSDKREAIIIVSSVQVFTTNPVMESWGHFPKEQERLWNLLRRHYSMTSTPVFFLSGDVHHAEISGQNGFTEITSSGLTHHCGQPKLYGHMCKPLLTHFNKHRHSPDEYYIGLNYGVIDLDWTKRTITFQIKDSFGSPVLSYSQGLNTDAVNLGVYKDLPQTWDGHLIPLFKFVMLSLSLLTGFLAQQRTRKKQKEKKMKKE